jgi:SAM-dependent methyltransferase
MNLGTSSMLFAAALTLACARTSADRDSQIGRTTYDGTEAMQPSSGAVEPDLPANTVLPSEREAERTPAPAPEPTSAPATIGSDTANAEPKKKPDVIYVPTPQPIVNKMLELAKVTKNDLVYDLGCGDGRIVVTAAKRYGARAVGFEIDPKLVAEARQNVKKNRVEHLVTIEEKDIFKLDLTPATVITLYLLPELNDRLVPQLERLAAGSRVVSHNYGITGVEPAHSLEMTPKGEDEAHSVFFYTLPFKRRPGLALPRAVVPSPPAP